MSRNLKVFGRKGKISVERDLLQREIWISNDIKTEIPLVTERKEISQSGFIRKDLLYQTDKNLEPQTQ